MIPAHCRVKHDPDAGTYGDCVRACVASLLEYDTEAVPHFCHDNPDGTVAFDRLREWLKPHGLAPFVMRLPPDPLADVLAFLGEDHPEVHYMLFGVTVEGGDHVVIAKGGKIVHNPAWFGCSIVAPASIGFWQVVVLVRL